METIGFIGLGIMGKPMAGHLIRGGHSLFLLSRSGVPDELAALGGAVCETPREVARQAEMIITMVPDTPDVEKVLFGENGVASGLPQSVTGSGQRRIVIDMSTISPQATQAFAARIHALGHDYVDAPVSGGDIGAQNASLTIMVGAEAAVFEKVKPIFELIGKQVTLIGGNGAGQICKIANQIIGEMYKRDDFSNNYTRAWNTYVLNVCALKLMQQEGEISYRQYIEDSCDYLQYMIDSMTSAPRQMWNYEQLENCIAWIRENEPKLREETL